MLSTITRRGQTVVPAAIRKRFKLDSSIRLEWIARGDHIVIVPVPADAIAAFRGSGSGCTTDHLLQERQSDRQREG